MSKNVCYNGHKYGPKREWFEYYAIDLRPIGIGVQTMRLKVTQCFCQVCHRRVIYRREFCIIENDATILNLVERIDQLSIKASG